MRVNTRADLDHYLADASTKNAALGRLQALLDERYEWIAGVWGVNPNAPYHALGITVDEAVALGCENREIPEPKRPSAAEAEAAQAMAEAKAELARLDVFLPRSVEDLLDAGAVQECGLSSHNLARLARKRELRSMLHA
jgi:hypothetical protein